MLCYRYIVDSGFVKQLNHNSRVGLDILEVVPISKYVSVFSFIQYSVIQFHLDFLIKVFKKLFLIVYSFYYQYNCFIIFLL